MNCNGLTVLRKPTQCLELGRNEVGTGIAYSLAVNGETNKRQEIMNRKYQAERFAVGCYVDESAGSADDCNRRTVEFARYYGFKPGRGWTKDSDSLSWTGDSAVDYLNEQETRSFMSWSFEDNSLFLIADVDGAREDVGFVSTKEQDYPSDDYRGEWLHVSDHGNATLYCRDEKGNDVEIWSVV